MRPTPLLLAVALLAAGSSGARANLTLPIDQEVGTLTCEARSTAGPMFATAPVVDCAFISDRDGALQTYVGLLPGRPQKAGALAPIKMSWRVATRNGIERPGMLSGLFSDPAEWMVGPKHGAAATLIGKTASLRPMAGEPSSAKPLPGLELIATSAVAMK